VESDELFTSYAAAAFDDKHVGTGKTVTVTGISVTGDDVGNYTHNTNATTTADITQRTLTVTATGVNKVYDSTTAATVTLSDDRLEGDTLNTAYASAEFDTKHVGTGKTVAVTGISVTGDDAGNYSFNTTASTTADITAATVTGSITADNKVYDGTTSATIASRSLSGAFEGDDVSLTGGSANFESKTVGTGKTVTATGLSLDGADAGNYQLASTSATTAADITAATVTGSITADNKLYDGTADATIASRSLTGAIEGDEVSLIGGTATFANKEVGTGKLVTATGLSLSGADAGNYELASTSATTFADITGRSLTVTATGVSRVYDGTTDAAVTLSHNGVAGDDLTPSYTAAEFDTKHVGTGKSISVTGITVTGADAGNYSFNTTASASADISAATVTGSITADNKVYDGNTSATIASRSLTGVISPDDVELSGGTATFDTKHVGDAKTVTATGLSLSGADAGNYELASTSATALADITARTLTVSATGVNRVYDGTADATVTLSDDRVSDDALSTSYTSASFDNKNVGTGKPVSVSGINVTGADAGNYTFNTTAATTANITPATVTGHVTASNKVYDGTAAATIASRSLTGEIEGDDVSLSGGTALFSDKHVGDGKTVTATGLGLSGTDAGNYELASTSATTTADITARTLVVEATGDNKAYDGTTAATVTLSDDRVESDELFTSYAAAEFVDKNIGTNITINVTGISVTGADAGNYLYNSNAVTAADITARALTVSATGDNKVYDGTTDATVTLFHDGVETDDLSASYATAEFEDRNAGTNKTINVTGISVTGADAGNYTFNTETTATADITPER
jgi:hypothetical protein